MSDEKNTSELDRSEFDYAGTGRYRVHPDHPQTVVMHLGGDVWMDTTTEERFGAEDVEDWTELVKLHRQPGMLREPGPVDIHTKLWVQHVPLQRWVLDLGQIGLDQVSAYAPGLRLTWLDGREWDGTFVIEENGVFGPVISRDLDRRQIVIDWAYPHSGTIEITWAVPL